MHAVLRRFFRSGRVGDPDPAAAGAAAERVVAISWHLDEFAADQLQNFARRLITAIHAAEMAGIVESYALVQTILHFEPVGSQKLGEERAVVRNRGNLTEGRILIAYRVVAVRVRRYDALERLGARHLLDVVTRKLFK